MKCPGCGKELTEETRFCKGCGRQVPRCPTCGRYMDKRQKFCPADGTAIPAELYEQWNAPGAETQTSPVQPTAFQRGNIASGGSFMEKNGKALLAVLIVLLVAAIGVIAFLALNKDKEEEAIMDIPGIYFDPEDYTYDVHIDLDDYEFDYEYDYDYEWDDDDTYQPGIEASQNMYMPNCVGLTEDEALELLADMDVMVYLESEHSDTVAQGRVIRQSIWENQQIYAGESIYLVISAGADVSPQGYNQKVVVTAAPGSSYGTLRLYQWENGGWTLLMSCDASVGKNGISSDYGEGRKRTPMGTFRLGIALSANSIPNRNWPQRIVNSNTCIVDDVYSYMYNTLQTISSLPSGTSYDPVGTTLTSGASNILIYIEHNGSGIDSSGVVAGKGSVITICGRSSSIAPTAGCVDISAYNMNTLISLLDYNMNPHIEIYCE